MAYDPATQQLVLFGGLSRTALGDTWMWSGTTWTQQFPATSPPARDSASMAYDAATQQLVLFGGEGSTNQDFSDTWTWSGTNWTQLSPATNPPARAGSSMAYDASAHQLVLFGGSDGTHDLRRHLDLERHHLDPTIPSHQPVGALFCRDGFVFADRPDHPLRGHRVERLPRRHLDLEYDKMDPTRRTH